MSELNKILKQCLNRKIEPSKAVDAIDSFIGGITAVYFNRGKRFTIQNHEKAYSLNYNGGMAKKKEKLLYNLAYLAYKRARENGNYRCGEIHIDSQTSTKHHKLGLAYLNQ